MQRVKAFDLSDYQEILDNLQDGFVVVDKSLTYVYVNAKAEEMIGISAEKLIGKKFTKTFPDHNLNLPDLLRIVQTAWIERKPATLEIYFKPQQRWYFLLVYPFREKFCVIFRDITKEKEIEGELQSSQKQLDLIFKNVSDGIVIQEKSGKMLYVNTAALRMGYSAKAEELLGASGFTLQERYDIFDEQKKPISWKDAPGRQVLLGTQTTAEGTICLVDKKTGEELWVNVRSAKIPSGSTSEEAAISVLHNVTLLKLLEQQKDHFLSLVSHELKTPLTSLKVYAQMLREKYSNSKRPDITNLINKININTDKLIELVHSLLDVSRIQEGKLLLKKRRFSLNILVREIAEDIQQTTKHPIKVIEPRQLFIYADRDRLGQVLTNLMTNALKYSRDTSRIVIKIALKKEKIEVSVQDYGTGIAQKDQPEVFKRFYQSREHDTFPGLGLGLYISSEIITAHGGTMWVKSKEKEGSTFYFSLPTGNKNL